MTVEFLAPARQEWLQAVNYYNEQRADLGYEFALEAERAIQRAKQFPEAWALVGPRTRRVLLHRFPYGILYFVREDRIVVTAVMNLRRRPQNLE